MVRTTSGLAVVAAQQQQLTQALAAYSALLGRQGAPSQGWQASPPGLHLPRSLAPGQVQAHMVGPTLASGFAPPPGGLPASSGAAQAVGLVARPGLLPSSSGPLGSGTLPQFGGAQPLPAAPSSAAGPAPALPKAGGPHAQASTTFAGHQQQQQQLQLHQQPSLPSPSSGQGFDLTFSLGSQAGQYTPAPSGQPASLPSLDAGMGLLELNGTGNLGLSGSETPQGAGSGTLGQLQGVPGVAGPVPGEHLRLSCRCLDCPQQVADWAGIITPALRAEACSGQCLPHALASLEQHPADHPGVSQVTLRSTLPS